LWNLIIFLFFDTPLFILLTFCLFDFFSCSNRNWERGFMDEFFLQLDGEAAAPAQVTATPEQARHPFAAIGSVKRPSPPVSVSASRHLAPAFTPPTPPPQEAPSRKRKTPPSHGNLGIVFFWFLVLFVLSLLLSCLQMFFRAYLAWPPFCLVSWFLLGFV
jgi:hypothetical protein